MLSLGLGRGEYPLEPLRYDEIHQDSVQGKVFSEQVKILHKNLLVSVPANFMCAVIVFFGLYGEENTSLLSAWIIAVSLVSLFRLTAFCFYHHHPLKRDHLHLIVFIFGMALSAALWGLADSFLMPKDNAFQQMIMIVIIAGITSGGIQTLNANLIASLIYVILIILPLCIWLFIQNGFEYLLLGFALSTYLLFMLATSVRAYKLLLKALTLQYENISLFEKLSASNTKLLNSYKMLEDHEQKMVLINKMNELLQASHESNEAYFIVSSTAKELFEEYSGGLALINPNTNSLETVLQWGDGETLKSIFSITDCWALRKGNKYIVNNKKNNLICGHFNASPNAYACLPLGTQSQVMGILILYSALPCVFTEDKLQLADTFCEVIQLSLANIRLRESLYYQSTHDTLTGLFNRRYIDEALARELRRVEREKNSLCVAMFDLDHFKAFNDTNGHEAGDEVLAFIGRLFKENFRGSDITCRFGGEEFLVVLVNSKLSDAAMRLQSFCDTVKKERIIFHGKALPAMTISIGVAEAPKHGVTAKEIVRAADEALYCAKKNGRDRVEVFRIT
jgi:diguanylate cyclase (GGDEF)-like protein